MQLYFTHGSYEIYDASILNISLIDSSSITKKTF